MENWLKLQAVAERQAAKTNNLHSVKSPTSMMWRCAMRFTSKSMDLKAAARTFFSTSTNNAHMKGKILHAHSFAS